MTTSKFKIWTAFLLAVGATLVAPVLAGPARTASEASATRMAPPNIVFIMVDDMRDDDLRFMPNTLRLIRDKGVRFVNAFSPFPLCCPARASVLTGLYTHNHRVYSVQADYGFHAFDDRTTMATMLQRAGYTTVYLGKYLNRYGIDPPHGSSVGNSLHYVPPGWSRWRASIDWSTYRFMGTVLSDDGVRLQSLAGRFQTQAYGDIAARIIRYRAADVRPYFFYLSFTAPHSGGPPERDDPAPTRRSDGVMTRWATTARPANVWGLWDAAVTRAPGVSWNSPYFGDKPDYLHHLPLLNRAERRALLEVTRQRAESLTVVDRQVRAIMTALEATGELARTVVVFTSDNGYFLGEQRMRQGKIFPHEPALRVPLLMRGPGIPAGGTRRDPFTSIDFLPTLAQAAGTVPDSAPDGVSLWDVAQRGDTGWTRAVLTETGGLGYPPRDTNQAGAALQPGESADIRLLIGVRTPRYLYVDVAHQRDELYDLRSDPREYRNLVQDPAYSDVKALLMAELSRMRTCRGQTCSAPMPGALTGAP